MDMTSIIEVQLRRNLELLHLDIINESSNHNVPKDSQTHFKVVMVSNDFDKMPLLARHRKVYESLSGVLQDGVHALSIHALTEQEWQEKHGHIPLSPPCQGGEKQQTGS